ncbi:MAG: Homoserine dehydrogenase [Syntrophus sp. PtaU1.Bin005]|nr:MAG: Homoserine dehydrogenase [Syntrophus sp. PtaB.Bin138]OPY83455.1 MAG: Homoserine dehydrogenase [Syntrophus sp. PtaU1.Bin005]
MRHIHLGLIGFGNIGTGVVKLLRDNADILEKRLGTKLVLKKIVDIDIESPRLTAVEPQLLSTDADAILNDPEIDIVIELVGGYQPALKFISDALNNGKHVVTANKALLATYGNDLFQLAAKKQRNICFEASVGGTIPIIKTIREGLVANRIRSVLGIMNGTSNYILTKMTTDREDFETVLKEAQELGFAEADPTFDVEGVDAAHKLALVLTLAYGRRVPLDDLYREGISGISQQDVEFAGELGYHIKLLAIARQHDELIEARIHPTMVPFHHLLANVNGNYNAFHIIGDASDSVFLYGQGAGMMPTASAVISDVIDISRDILKGVSWRVPARSFQEETIEDINLMPVENIMTHYYFRFSALDRPGVLSRIAGILAEENISIATVIQKGRKKGQAVPIVMTTHKSTEQNVRRALEQIDRLDIVQGQTVLIRIEDDRLP